MAGAAVLMAATMWMVPAERRGQATGIINAGGSFGQFALAPIAATLMVSLGWAESHARQWIRSAVLRLRVGAVRPPTVGAAHHPFFGQPTRHYPISEAIHGQFWNEQLETLIAEIARQATVAHVPLVEPGVVEAVLRDDEASCGSTNPMAFRKLREALMMVFVVQKKAYDDLGPLETEAMIA